MDSDDESVEVSGSASELELDPSDADMSTVCDEDDAKAEEEVEDNIQYLRLA